MLRNFLTAIIFSATVIFSSAVQAAVPNILADSAILIEATTGRVIFEKNADDVRAPASMTKMMTAILGIEYLQPTDQVTISASAAATEYSDLHLQAGDIITADNLLQGTLLVSDNGGAVAIAQAVGGNVPNFAQMMNDKAKEIGCTSTNFENPHGLTSQNHFSTARDMSKIAAYCMKNSTFRRYVGKSVGKITLTDPPMTFDALSTNKLLETYPGITGIKTGYTSAAGGCLAASAKRGDIELIAVVMHSDMESRFIDAAQLLDYGFENVDSVKKVEVGEVEQIVYVRDGKNGSVHVEPQEDFNFPLLKDEDESLLTISYDLPKIIDAEVERGAVIGDAILNYDGEPVAKIPLTAMEGVEQGFSFSSWLVELSQSFQPGTQDFLLSFVA